MKNGRLISFVTVAAAFLPAGTTAAQEPLRLSRISGVIELDGNPNEPVWSDIEPLPLVMYQPVYGGEMSQRTVVRVGYDEHYFYVAGELYVDDATLIRANSMYRDRYSGDDTFAIIIDAFNDNENALWFFTTPNGVRVDLAVANDANSGFGSINTSWNTYWDVATRQTDQGWFAEMRIPFSSLGFQNTGETVRMGMTVYRYIAVGNERHIFPPIRPDWDMGFAKASQAADVILDGVKSSNPVYVTPYVLGGVGQTSELSIQNEAYRLDRDMTRDVGVDLKYSLTSNLTLDVTANTDFAQVEADDEEVNLTRFSLFFPEKRQFFQERSGVFEYDLGGPNRVFYSRRIGLNEDDEAVRILGGARLVGRVGEWDVGVVNMQTEKTSDVSSENFGIVRLRRRVINPHSYVGTIATSRLTANGSYNLVYGADAIVRVTGDEYLAVQVVQSVDDHVVDSTGFKPLDATVTRLVWERRSARGLAYSTTLSRVGADYQPDMGFQTRTNYWQPRGTLSYGWFFQDSRFRRVATGVSGAGFFSLTDGSVQSADFEYEIDAEFMSGAGLSAETEVHVDKLEEPLELSDEISVPVGRYTFTTFSASFEMPEGKLFRTRLRGEAGRFYDGNLVTVSMSPVWYASRFVELGGDIEATRIRFPSREQSFDFVIARIRSQFAFNTRASVGAFVQFNSEADLVSANVRFRYNFREGQDLWLVYNEGLNTDRYSEVPTLPVTDNRTILLKYTHTFGL